MIKITQIIRPPLIRALFILEYRWHLFPLARGYFRLHDKGKLAAIKYTHPARLTYREVIVIFFAIIMLMRTMDWRRDHFSVVITTNGMGAQYADAAKGFRAAFATGHHMIDKADDMQPELMPRNWLQRLLGGYGIMGKDGKGFAFNKRLFSKEQLKIIDAKLQEFYGLAL